MRTFEMYLSGVFGLILVYLLVKDATAVNNILKGFAGANVEIIRALQVR